MWYMYMKYSNLVVFLNQSWLRKGENETYKNKEIYLGKFESIFAFDNSGREEYQYPK